LFNTKTSYPLQVAQGTIYQSGSNKPTRLLGGKISYDRKNFAAPPPGNVKEAANLAKNGKMVEVNDKYIRPL
jgi:hypothetical protein